MDSRMSLFPLNSSINDQDHLTISGVDVCNLAKEYGTPLYIYDASTIRHNIDYLHQLLTQYYSGDGKVAYASKAFLSLPFARKMRKLGTGLDVVSLVELEIGRAAGFSADGIHLHGNNKTREEIEAALDWDIQAIVIDSVDELKFVAEIAERKQKVARCWLRLTPDLVINTHKSIQTGHADSKFGLHVQNREIDEALQFGIAHPWINITGIHMHLGSQIRDTEVYVKAVRVMYEMAQANGFVPLEVSPGGGWGVRYTESDPEINTEAWVIAVCHAVETECAKRGWALPTLVLEPGRWLVAQSAVALYSVGSQKTTPGGTHITALDGGLADNPRVEMYGAHYTAKAANHMTEEDSVATQLVGRYCESGDILIEHIRLPQLQRGDVIAIPVAGAYQLSMSSNYNLIPRPAVLWLENGAVSVLHSRENLSNSTWWTSTEKEH